LSILNTTSTAINYNWIPKQDELEKFLAVLKYVDTAYLILRKCGLGRKQSTKSIQEYQSILKQLDTVLNEENKKKIIIDSCVVDSYNYLTQGHGCRANIGKIHIWPDGHVSGCPYNMDGGRPATNLIELVENIDEVFNYYEFKECNIPNDYFLNWEKKKNFQLSEDDFQEGADLVCNNTGVSPMIIGPFVIDNLEREGNYRRS
jgi:hypothetical protein